MKVQTKWIEDSAIIETKINNNAVTTDKINADAVTKAKVNADVAGDGLAQAAGGELDVKPDSTSADVNVAKVVNVDATHGVGIKIDDDTIDEVGNQLAVKANGIGAAEIDETDTYDFSASGVVKVATPDDDAKAANKGYVDSVAQGLIVKGACLAVAVANHAITGLPTNIDGVTTWADGDRVLLTNQGTASQNGIWEVHATAWTRPTDFDTGDRAASAFTFIEQGTLYADSGWVCTTDGPNDVIDTNDLAFAKFSGAGQITAGTGLTKDGNTIHAGDGTVEGRGGLDFQADDIAVKPDITAETTTEANAVAVTNAGVNVKVDDSTIEGSLQGSAGAESLRVKDDGITAAKLNSNTAGEGVKQEALGALALDIGGLTEDTDPGESDQVAVWDGANNKRMSIANLTEKSYKYMHLVTAGEVTAGLITLSSAPVGADEVSVTPVGGPEQVNKQQVASTGATPDFDVLNSTELHINNNGAATGLSEVIEANDILMIEYVY